MSEPYLAEIRLFPFGYAPRGWAACEGQTLPIASNQALYSLVGNVYGGDGKITFALPDLRGRVPIHVSSTIGAKAGEESHVLTVNEMPAHTHFAKGSSVNATAVSPQNNVWASQVNIYGSPDSLASMNNQAISPAGGSLPHYNMQPFLPLYFCIALQGIFPPRN